MTVLDYCKGLERKEYIYNRDYQRSDAVWPVAAKSFLIETILLDYPIPKLSIYQRLDLRTRTVVKEVVDGQQRSQAILDFYQNRLPMAKDVTHDRFLGRTFEELDEGDQAQFMNYGLNFDIFVGVTSSEVREVFRRMNSFTVPLNQEEQRHAYYQGPFKWFINALSRDYDRNFFEAGVFLEKQLNRMAETKLLTEIASGIIEGITTTNKASLDRLYRINNEKFGAESDLNSLLRFGLDASLGDGRLWKSPLMRPYNFYSLCLAHVHASGRKRIVEDPSIPVVKDFVSGDPQYNLSLLASVLATKDAAEWTMNFSSILQDDFLRATKEKTNVAAQRIRRFEFFLAALTA